MLKPSLAEFGPVDTQTASRLSVCSDGQESMMVQAAVEAFDEAGEKLCCGLELPCLPGPSGSGSTYELVCVDEWLKTRTESLSSMDMDVAMKSDGIDSNYLSDSGVSKENPNLSELDQFLTPKGAVDLCIVNDVCNVHVNGSRKGLGDLGETEDSGLLLSDDLLLKEGPSGKKALFMMETMDDAGGKDLKDDDGLGRRGSWADSLELGKDKVNWESMSNTSRRSHELEKEVDFPEFNLVPSFDPLCSIECSLPVGKELEDASCLDKDEETDLSVIPLVSNKSDDLILETGDPVLPSIHDTLDQMPIISSKSNHTSAVSLLKNPISKVKREREASSSSGDESGNNVAVIAISTNKVQNTTQIVIRTPHGDQQVFKGKTSDLVQATSGMNRVAGESKMLLQKRVSASDDSSDSPRASSTRAFLQSQHSNSDSGDDSGSEGTSEDQLAMDLGNCGGDKADSSGEGNDEGDGEHPFHS